ncbi:MAG: GGDEF domain-containing protein [Aeromicrobium sp.]
MDLELETLLIACALAIVVVTAVFATTAALRHNDEANRAWTASFAAALCATGLEAIYGTGAVPTVVVAVVDASTIFAVGAMWAGCRLLDSRPRSYTWVAFIVAVLAMVPTLLQSPNPDLDLSAAIRLGATGVFSWLTAVELLRGKMRLNLNGRILQVAFFAVGAWYIGAAAISLAAAGDGRIERPALESTALPFVGVFIVAAVCLSALRVEQSGNWWSMSADTRRRTTIDVLTADAFRDDARDRVERATLAGSHVALVLAEIDHLDELNSAFGRESGDRALVHFAEILRTRVSADALLGHLGAGRFVVLLVAASPAVPLVVVDAIRTGLTEASVSEGMELRVSASFGTSHSADTPATFDALLAKAGANLDRAHA